jgi:hypothetical protein
MIMTKKQVKGKEFFSSPHLNYKRELLDLGDSSVWVREPSTYALSLFKEEGDALSQDYSDKILTREQYVDRANTISARLVIACVCDEAGELIGDESNIEAVKDMPNRIVNMIIAKAFNLAGVPFKEVEEVAANLKKEGIA